LLGCKVVEEASEVLAGMPAFKKAAIVGERWLLVGTGEVVRRWSSASPSPESVRIEGKG
jgi:hypothetical protein